MQGYVVTGVDRMVGMTCGTLNRENTVGGVDATGIDASVLAPVDVTALDDEVLEARLRQIGRARTRLEGFLAQVATRQPQGPRAHLRSPPPG